MADKPWKAHERKTAALLGGKRYTANQGGPVDVESDGLVVQCKEVKRLSLAELGKLAQEAERQGQQKGKIGLVVVKHRAGRGHPTPLLVVMTIGQYREQNGLLPSTVPFPDAHP